MTALLIVIAWSAAAVVAGLVVGRVFRMGRGDGDD